MESTSLVDLALEYCQHFHDGQFRKGSNNPYSTHPIAVAGILEKYGYSDVVTQCIALLHDVVEDTDVITREIKERFGYEIANGVFILSKNTINSATFKSLEVALSTDIALNFEQVYKVRIALARETVQRVKIADMIHNTQDLVSLKKPESIEKKLHDATHFYIPLGERVAPLMVKELKHNLDNYRRSIEKT